MGSPGLDRFAHWPRPAEAGGRPALALMALAGRIEAGGRGGRSLWAAASARSHAPPGSAVGAMQLWEPEVHDVAKAVWPRLPG